MHKRNEITIIGDVGNFLLFKPNQIDFNMFRVN